MEGHDDLVKQKAEHLGLITARYNREQAELAVLRDIANAAQAVHDSKVVWGSFGVGAARVGVVTWNALGDKLDAYDALGKEGQ